MTTNEKLLIQAKFSKPLQRTLLVIGCLILFISGFIYWRHQQHYVSTDDAYVGANVVQIATRVTGQVTQLYCKNNQYVAPGQLLLQVDPVPFAINTAKAKAELAMSEAQWRKDQIMTKRTLSLVKQNSLPQQDADNALATLQSSVANVQLAKANLAQAELEQQFTKIKAPTSGWITNQSLRVGSIAVVDIPLFALISDQEFWIDANFEETELQPIKVGQTALIKTDMYPHHLFHGVVESISGGSGAAFSLLPPQNATGNWVKVTQRVPVRIQVTDPIARYPLRIGTTVDVTIDIQSH